MDSSQPSTRDSSTPSSPGKPAGFTVLDTELGVLVAPLKPPDVHDCIPEEFWVDQDQGTSSWVLPSAPCPSALGTISTASASWSLPFSLSELANEPDEPPWRLSAFSSFKSYFASLTKW